MAPRPGGVFGPKGDFFVFQKDTAGGGEANQLFRYDGATGAIRVTLYNRPGTLAEMAGVFAGSKANVVNLELTHRDDPFHTYDIDLEVRDLAHLTRIVSALRASDAIAQAERI